LRALRRSSRHRRTSGHEDRRTTEVERRGEELDSSAGATAANAAHATGAADPAGPTATAHATGRPVVAAVEVDGRPLTAGGIAGKISAGSTGQPRSACRTASTASLKAALAREGDRAGRHDLERTAAGTTATALPAGTARTTGGSIAAILTASAPFPDRRPNGGVPRAAALASTTATGSRTAADASAATLATAAA
jgi:hypothetical protein